MGLNERNLFIELSRLDMYVAKMPEGMSEATYFIKIVLFILMNIFQLKIEKSSLYMNAYITFRKLKIKKLLNSHGIM